MKKIICFCLILLFTLFGQSAALEKAKEMSVQINTSAGRERSPNHLAGEKSPYLLQHLYNPVDWYPWGDEAFLLAEKEDRPVFLSIGYSTCHWCHVMAHESFDDQAVADFLNQHFISIKVDREELPGVDQIYMAATQAMTGSGGWPMSLFLFPDRKPFYAGTYFPPESGYGRPGFMDLLRGIVKAWETDRKSLSLSAEQVTSHIQKEASSAQARLDDSWLEKGFDMIRTSYEPKYGGFAQSPKFPRPVVLDFLLQYYRSHQEKEARDMALYTLEQMAGGGMYDHVGGGFHRYSVDGRWRIPHFEKMLYDQAQLVNVYLDAFQLNKNPLFKKVAKETLEYVLRSLTDGDGGFYSAEDADSVNPYNNREHGEGAYYLWTEEEIDSLLDEKDAVLFKACYGVRKNGNALHDPQEEFTGRNILYWAEECSGLARRHDITERELERSLFVSGKVLLARRQKRTPPHLDDKIITAWNGLMISAFARGYMVLADERYLQAAKGAADFLKDNLIAAGELKRRWRKGDARHPAGLDDYAFYIQGLLDLYQAAQLPQYLQQSLVLSEKQIALYSDPNGGFFDTARSAALLARMKAAYDGAEPSGNSVAARNMQRLAHLSGQKRFAEIAEKGIVSFAKTLRTFSPAMPLMLTALDRQLQTPKQIVIAGVRGRADTNALLAEVHSRYLPTTQLLLADGAENQQYLEKSLPFLNSVEQVDGRATAYVCENFSCKMPVSSPNALAELIK